MSGRLYRVVKRFPWIEGGRPTPGGGWEGGDLVVYEPGDTVYIEDQDVKGTYFYLEAIDDAGRAILEEAKPSIETVEFVTSFNPEQHNIIAWALVRRKLAQGEGLKKALLWAIRNGAVLPDDYESSKWFSEALEGKHEPKRGRGRPQKPRPTPWDISAEDGIVRTYEKWLGAFQSDREVAWLRFEAMRLQQKQGGVRAWRRQGGYDLGTEEGKQSYQAALTNAGARPCPPAREKAAETARELALEATAQECNAVREDAARLTPSSVARLVTRAKKSK